MSSTPDIPYAFLVEQSIAGMYVIQDEHFQYANATWAALVGCTPDEMVGRHVLDFVPPYFHAEVRERMQQRLAGDPPTMRYVTHGLHQDGRVVMIEVHGSSVPYRGRPAIVGVGIDVSERVRNEEALRRSNEQLQQLARHTARLLEEQRLKLSHEVHDVLGGILTSMKMDATRVLRRADTPELAGITQGLLDLAQEAIAAVRRIAEDLRPGALDHLDLSVALAQALQAFEARHGVRCTLDAPDPTPRLAPATATAVYRIVQEALTNVARHAAASRVTVRLTAGGGTFGVEVEDDGRGFDPAWPRPQSLGLLTMSERAREAGARFAIEARPGAGTRITVAVPLP
jgi:PAS domain S-box-containing protein